MHDLQRQARVAAGGEREVRAIRGHAGVELSYPLIGIDRAGDGCWWGAIQKVAIGSLHEAIRQRPVRQRRMEAAVDVDQSWALCFR
ncbi:MAG: hypothetical protein NTZ79_18040 [Proteobacteria bacterium]|nr:hypothetical protein [Pseudomonadota bacterium]